MFLQLDETLIDTSVDPPPEPDPPVLLDEPVIDDHHLSLNALKGGKGIGTIRFLAYVDKLPVTVLIDGDGSDNFLHPRIAKFLKLPVEPAPMFKVMVGSGNYMATEGLVQNVVVQAQGNTLQLPDYLLPISGVDLILGAHWLKTIGPHVADYESLNLKFLHDGKFVTFQGDVD